MKQLNAKVPAPIKDKLEVVHKTTGIKYEDLVSTALELLLENKKTSVKVKLIRESVEEYERKMAA